MALFWPSLIASIASLSIGEAAVYRRNHTQLSRDRFVATVALASLLLGFSAILAAVPLLPRLLGSDRTDELPMLTAYAAAFLPCYLFAMGLLSIDKSEHNFRRYNLIRLSNPLAYLIGISVLWMCASTDPQVFVWAAFVGTAVNAALCLWAFRQDLFAAPSIDEASRLLRRGIAFHGATIVTVVSIQADRLVVMSMFGNADIGKYVVAMTLASAVTALVTNSVHTVLFPSIAATTDRAAKVKQLQDGIRRTWFFVVGTSFLAAMLLPPLLPLIFGDDFRDARPLVAVLALAVAPMTVRQVVMACVRAFGDGRTGVVIEVCAVSFFVAFLLPALFIDELWAVAFAFGLANIAALLLTSHLLQRGYGIASASWLLPNARMVDDVRLITSRLSRVRAA